MTILIEPEHICALKDVGELLTEKIQQFSKGVAPKEGAWRIEIPLERLDLLAWLAAQETDLKIFWSSRDEQFETAGVGAAHEIIGSKAGDYTAVLRQMNSILDSQSKARYFGGCSFHDQGSSRKWQSFGSHRFILPRFEVCQTEKKTVFACNIRCNGFLSATTQSVLKELKKISFLSQKSSEKMPLVKSRQDHPSREQWMDTVKKTLMSFKNSEYKKVVLARQSTFELSNILFR
jgi:menaquinone-specific isochorismate synthase